MALKRDKRTVRWSNQGHTTQTRALIFKGRHMCHQLRAVWARRLCPMPRAFLCQGQALPGRGVWFCLWLIRINNRDSLSQPSENFLWLFPEPSSEAAGLDPDCGPEKQNNKTTALTNAWFHPRMTYLSNTHATQSHILHRFLYLSESWSCWRWILTIEWTTFQGPKQDGKYYLKTREGSLSKYIINLIYWLMSRGLTWVLIFLDGWFQTTAPCWAHQEMGPLSGQAQEQSFWPEPLSELAQWVCPVPGLWVEHTVSWWKASSQGTFPGTFPDLLS